MTASADPLLVLHYSNDLSDIGGLPEHEFVQHWLATALAGEIPRSSLSAIAAGAPINAIGVSVHLTDAASSQALNRDFRDVDKPTNVLSFPAGLPVLDGELTLGELVLCPEVVQREAQAQRKPMMHHWAHLLVHGSLHLVGLDHEEDIAAERMEALEIRILSSQGISDPYRDAARELDE